MYDVSTESGKLHDNEDNEIVLRELKNRLTKCMTSLLTNTHDHSLQGLHLT